ncbi:hypothetical protein HHK36_011535 [Tetracentron sinense]|uniref:Exostosin GT47 domain-containing protein n=1 Tax=Tetracentron sinense TaxID=13715 RepID=A0A834ZGH9_TETSI|nr:hypothetical protein HHK36_011535 [Tetracentron sinense]
MARSSFLVYYFSRRRFSESFRSFFFIATCLSLTTSLLILFYISSTSKLFIQPDQTLFLVKSSLGSSSISPPLPTHQIIKYSVQKPPRFAFESVEAGKSLIFRVNGSEEVEKRWSLGTLKPIASNVENWVELIFSDMFELEIVGFSGSGNYVNNEVFHDRDIFIEDYGEMNRSFKIYVYPHKKDDPFANALLPVKFKPGGNYASESYFKKALMESHFITKDPTEADLFFLPFSIATLRYDPRVGVGGIQDFIRAYIYNISQNYPYWNRSGGADHFYIACHSIGRSAMEKVEKVKFNAIQVGCSSSYFLSGYVAHKDASLPQIWPRQGYQPYLASSKR